MERKLRQGGIPTAVRAAPPLEAWEGRQQRQRVGCQRRDAEVVWEARVGNQGHRPTAHIKLASRAEE